MKIHQHHWTRSCGWQPPLDVKADRRPQLVLVFGYTDILADGALIADIRRAYPNAIICGASTAGEIMGTQVYETSVTATAVYWRNTSLKIVGEKLRDAGDSATTGRRLGERLDGPDLRHVMVFSDGLHINGSELVRGLRSAFSPRVTVTGGLAGDGDRFGQTFVIWNDQAETKTVTALGFYGPALRVGYGSVGGWDPFGPERLVTRSRGNVLYELDDRQALALYKLYLGQHAQNLPASGLFFPLSLRISYDRPPVVRTLLSIDEGAGSITFAGDIPEGSYVRLMKADIDRLIDGAAQAAQNARGVLGSRAPELVVLISCVGRKLVLDQRTEEELEAVQDILGPEAVYTGFYSYGEIAPISDDTRCELHNQTMTVTALTEEGPPHA